MSWPADISEPPWGSIIGVRLTSRHSGLEVKSTLSSKHQKNQLVKTSQVSISNKPSSEHPAWVILVIQTILVQLDETRQTLSPTPRWQATGKTRWPPMCWAPTTRNGGVNPLPQAENLPCQVPTAQGWLSKCWKMLEMARHKKCM